MEELVLAIGGCHGSNGDKIQKFNIPICRPGWSPISEDETNNQLEGDIAISTCVAHLVCHVNKFDAEADNQHFVIFCQITKAFVKTQYWSPKGQFIPQSNNVPPYLTFLGAQTFALTVSPSK